MQVALSADQERFVRGLVAGGHYASEQEVIDAALRLPGQDGEAALRAEIALGIEQADRGELTAFEPRATLRHIRSRRAG